MGGGGGGGVAATLNYLNSREILVERLPKAAKVKIGNKTLNMGLAFFILVIKKTSHVGVIVILE